MGSCGSFLCKCHNGDLESQCTCKKTGVFKDGWRMLIWRIKTERKLRHCYIRRRISSKQLHLSNLLQWIQTQKVKSKEVLYKLLPSPLIPANDNVVLSFLGYKQQFHCTVAACFFFDKTKFFLFDNLGEGAKVLLEILWIMTVKGMRCFLSPIT